MLVGCQFERPADKLGPDAPAQPVELALSVEGPGEGTVIVTPGDFICGSGTCMRTFDAGSEVTIDASPGSVFDGVGLVTGDCAALPCTLRLDGPRAVTVAFRRFTCEPNRSTCIAGKLTNCGADGEYASYVVPNGNGESAPSALTMHDYECPLGCHASQPRCADVDTRMELNGVLDSAAVSNSGVDVVIPAPGNPAGVVNLDTGAWDSALNEIRLTDTNGQTLHVPAVVVVQPAPAPEVLVLATRTFTLRTGSTLNVVGSRALAIVANYDVVVAGTIDLSAARNGVDTIGPGSFTNSETVCLGHFTNGVSGGGSNGCGAGNGSNGASRGDPPPVFPPALAGGCPGGGGTGTFQFGGIAGGALALVSRTIVTLGATSMLDLSGGHGWAAPGWATGGGSGGTVIVHAPALVVANGAIIANRGGSGAAAGPSTSAPGLEGTTTGTAGAAGGMCAGCGTGGTGTSSVGCGGNGVGSGTALGGGGGGGGKCIVYARSTPTIPTGTMPSGYSSQPLVVRSP